MTICAVMLVGFAYSVVASAALAADEFDAEKLVGTWSFVSSERGGEKAEKDRLQAKVVITKDTLTIKGDNGDFVMKYKLDVTKSPVTIDLTMTESPFGAGATAKGIIAVKEDQLRLCYDDQEGEAPKEFASKAGTSHRYLVMARVKE
jgi:uncharacterized protein (TIGR03067 family)